MARTPSILIVEDNQLDIKILQQLLHAYALTCVADQHAAFTYAKEELPDLIIVDGMKPDESAYTLCDMLRSGHMTAKIPVLFMYEGITGDQITRMFQAGGSDYINKPFNQVELLARVHVHIVNSTQRKRLELLAKYDPMTMCYNRRMFFEEAQKYMQYAHDKGAGLSIVIFDIISFHEINSEYGHFTGDTVLKQFVELVKSLLPKDVIIGRLGGKGFGVVMLGNSREDDTMSANKVLHAANALDVHGTNLVKVDYGLARRLAHDDTVDSVLLRASETLENCNLVRTSRNY